MNYFVTDIDNTIADTRNRLRRSLEEIDRVEVYEKTAGPLDSAEAIVMFFFQEGFNNFGFGYASAAAYILFFIGFVLTAINVRLSKRWVHYQ
ncbi:MAG: hypothetical protein ABEI54_01520 [Candidatus Bipolaricaulia bacterium]